MIDIDTDYLLVTEHNIFFIIAQIIQNKGLEAKTFEISQKQVNQRQRKQTKEFIVSNHVIASEKKISLRQKAIAIEFLQ